MVSQETGKFAQDLWEGCRYLVFTSCKYWGPLGKSHELLKIKTKANDCKRFNYIFFTILQIDIFKETKLLKANVSKVSLTINIAPNKIRVLLFGDGGGDDDDDDDNGNIDIGDHIVMVIMTWRRWQ